MRKIFAVLLVIIILNISAFADVIVDTKAVRMVTSRGVTYIINENYNVISDGTHEYTYTFSGDSSRYRVAITYPDGSTYWKNGNDGSASMGWSDDYTAFDKENEQGYTSGDVLCEALVGRAEVTYKSRKNPVFVIILAILGLLGLTVPEAMWYLQYGWRYKDAEPSTAALLFERIGGIVVLVLVVLYIFI